MQKKIFYLFKESDEKVTCFDSDAWFDSLVDALAMGFLSKVKDGRRIETRLGIGVRTEPIWV